MAQPDNKNTLSSAFKTFFEREKLTGDNFNDWYHSLRIILRVAGTYDYLFKPCLEEPPQNAAEDIKAAWKVEYKIHSDVACLMLRRMSPALQRQFELYFPQAMLDELRRMFEKPQAVEIYDLVDSLHSCKQAPGKSVSAHVLEMKGYMDQLQALGKPYDNDMAINLINRSLNKDFGDFVRNSNALRGEERDNKQVVAYQPKPKQNPPPQKKNPKKDQACHHCNVVGHWKRNYPLYLEELRINNNKKTEHGAAASDQGDGLHADLTRAASRHNLDYLMCGVYLLLCWLEHPRVDLNEPKEDSSKTDKAAQNGRAPKLLTLEIHHGGWFTPTPSRSYISGHVSSVNVVDIDEFWVHDLKYMVVKLGYGVEDLMYCHFLIPSLGLDYGLHSLNVDADVLEMSNSVEAPIVVECAEDPFEELDDLLGEYAHIVKQITGNEIIRNESTGNEIIGKQMVVHVGNSSTVDDVLELGMLFETEGVGNVGKFKEVEVDADNESEEESDTEGDYTMDSDSEDLDYDPKHDDVFDDDEHIVEEVHVNMNNFRFTTNPKHDTSIGGVDVQDDDLDIIDYDSVDSDLDDGIDSERRMQLRE
ncbi:hypothetical protein Tco_1194017 [Tanacetum coccineum]